MQGRGCKPQLTHTVNVTPPHTARLFHLLFDQPLLHCLRQPEYFDVINWSRIMAPFGFAGFSSDFCNIVTWRAIGLTLMSEQERIGIFLSKGIGFRNRARCHLGRRSQSVWVAWAMNMIFDLSLHSLSEVSLVIARSCSKVDKKSSYSKKFSWLCKVLL